MKYKVKLSDNFSHPAFTCSWSTTLLGEELRAEFSEYVEQYKKDNEIVEGGSEKILVSDVLETFMTQEKQINLIKDEGGQGLKSVFLIRPGESLVIDEQAYEALKRYEKKQKKNSDGTQSSVLGFMEFEPVGGPDKQEDVKVSGQRFGEFDEGEETIDKETESEPKEDKVICKECGKEFDTKRQLSGHMMSHK